MRKMSGVLPNLGSVVTYHPQLVRLLESLPSAILLNQLWWLSQRFQDDDGWFWHPTDRLCDETGLTGAQVLLARKVLREAGLLEERRDRLHHLTWYRLRLDELENRLLNMPPPPRYPLPPPPESEKDAPESENRFPESGKHFPESENHFPESTIGRSGVYDWPLEDKRRYREEEERTETDSAAAGAAAVSMRRTTPLPRTSVPDTTHSAVASGPVAADKWRALARQLADLVLRARNIKTPTRHVTEWATHFRRLGEEGGVTFERQQRVLDAYEKGYADKYMPKAESGRAWREKFVRIEQQLEQSAKPAARQRIGATTVAGYKYPEGRVLRLGGSTPSTVKH
jgi:hypothetical protein